MLLTGERVKRELIEDALVTSTEHEIKIEFDEKPSLISFTQVMKDVIDRLDYNWDRRGYVVYNKEVVVYHRGKPQKLSEVRASFFMNDNQLCFSTTPKGRTGYYVTEGMFSFKDIENITFKHKDHPELQEKELKRQENVWKRVQGAIKKSGAWKDLSRDRINSDSKIAYLKTEIERYDRSLLQKLEEYFEEQRDFRYEGYRMRNCYTEFEGKLGEDGIYRVWYARIYDSGLEGTYFLLTPTTALFIEHD